MTINQKKDIDKMKPGDKVQLDLRGTCQVGFENLQTGEKVMIEICLKSEVEETVDELRFVLDAINRCQGATLVKIVVDDSAPAPQKKAAKTKKN